MTNDKSIFYFANLGADVLRCALAAENSREDEYRSSMERAHRTLRHIEKEGRSEAYEEGLLLLRGLEYAREAGSLVAFRKDVNYLIEPFSIVLGFS